MFKYDGFGAFVTNYCIEMLEFCLKERLENQNFKFLDFKTNPIVEQLKNEDKLDIILLILASSEEYYKSFKLHL